ncbi:MAG: ChbG/HpnK family deacetylase, partial [bacterium]
MAPRLIVNADDLGMTPGVTRGIVETMTKGIVSSTTLMVNMPSAPDAG